MVTMSSVWDRTSAFLSDRFGAVATIAVLSMALPGSVQNMAQLFADAAGPGLKLALLLLMLIVAVVGLWGQAALIALVLARQESWQAAFAVGARRVPAIVGVSIVLMIAAIVLFLPPVILLAASGLDFAALAQGVVTDVAPGSALTVVLYALVLLPVVVWLAARLSVLTSVVVAEGLAIAAIARSWRLTRGHAGRIAGVLILIVVVGSVAALAAQTVVGSILRLVLGGEGVLDAATVLTIIVGALVSAALTSLLTLFTAHLYLALCERAAVAGLADGRADPTVPIAA